MAEAAVAYPSTSPLTDILEAALFNFNVLGHSAGSLLNAGAIEFAEMNGREYFMYNSLSTADHFAAVEGIKDNLVN